MKVLAVDCADKSVSCAISEDGKIIAESFSSTGFTHSKTMMPMIKSILEVSEISPDGIDLYAVTAGPGSFTGLRIAIAAVKGMAFKNNTPCMAVSTLHTIAAGAMDKKGIVCAVMDARCNQVYNALFMSDGQRLTRLTDDRALMCDELKEEIDSKYKNERVHIVGPGAEMFCNKYPDSDFVKPGRDETYPKASNISLILDGYEAVEGQKLMPFYLRLPQAERELKERNKNNG